MKIKMNLIGWKPEGVVLLLDKTTSKKQMIIKDIRGHANYCKLVSSYRINRTNDGIELEARNSRASFQIIMPRHKKWRGIMLYPPNF